MRSLRSLGLLAVLGLCVPSATADEPAGGVKAKVQVFGKFTADKDTTLNYTLKKGGKVVLEEQGLTSLPGKTVEVDVSETVPFELTLSAKGGVLKVSEIGITAEGGGKSWKGVFLGRVADLNAKDAAGLTVRAVSFPITLAPTKVDQPKGPEKKPEPKKVEKKSEEPKKVEKKPEEPKKVEEPKETKEPKKAEEPKEIKEPKKAVEPKEIEETKSLPVAPPPSEK